MLMTNGEIKEAIDSGELTIGSYDPRRQEPCSYDARAGNEALTSRTGSIVNLASANSITLKPGDFALIMTHESFTLPRDIAGHIGMKSTWARRGLLLLAGIQIDPGFDGHLRLGIYNCGGRPITIDYQDPICLIEFHRLSVAEEKGVGPFPELKEGRIPQNDKAYLRELETTSLSDVARDLRSLTQNVATLTNNVKIIIYIVATILGTLLATIFAGITIQLFLHLK